MLLVDIGLVTTMQPFPNNKFLDLRSNLLPDMSLNVCVRQ